MDANCLKINIPKTEYIKFGNPGQLRKCTANKINFEDIQIRQTDLVKILGFVMDKHLNYQKHIVNKCNKAQWNLSKIRNLRPHLLVKNTTQLILSLVISHMDFSNGLLTGLPNKSCKALQCVQNMSAKVILNKSYRESSSEYVLELHWLKVEYKISYKTCITVHNCLFGKALEYLQKKFNFKQSSERYVLGSTKELNMLEVPKTKCISYGDKAFSVYGAYQWNLSPSELRCKEDSPTFKKVLKLCYLNDATIYEMI